MPGSVSQDLNSLKNPNIIFSAPSIVEERDLLSELADWERKALAKDKAFMRIWDGGIMKCSLDLRSMVRVDEQNRLFLNGRRFTRSSWDWQPPPIIREQGRLAKEIEDPQNRHPEIAVELESGQVLWLDVCPCGGELIMDKRGELYCRECCKIY